MAASGWARANWSVVKPRSGTVVSQLAETVGATDLVLCRAVKDLVECGLVEVGEVADTSSGSGSEPVVSVASSRDASDATDEADATEASDCQPAAEPASPPVDAESAKPAETGDEPGNAGTPEPATGHAGGDPVPSLDGESNGGEGDYFNQGGVSHTARTRLNILTAAYVDDPRHDGEGDPLHTLMPEPLPGTGLTNDQLGDSEVESPFFSAEGAGPVAKEPTFDATSGDAGADAPAGPDAEAVKTDTAESDPDLTRQLSSLSPQAAAAIASAAGSLEGGRDGLPGRTRRGRATSRTR